MIAAVSVLKELSVNLINDLKLASSDVDHPPSGPIAMFSSSFLFFKSIEFKYEFYSIQIYII